MKDQTLAFPNPLAGSPAGDMYPPYDQGMTLRDYFAAAALQGECAAQDDVAFGTAIEDKDFKIWAKRAYKFADAMMERRSYEEDTK